MERAEAGGIEIRGLRVVDNIDSRSARVWRKVAPYLVLNIAQVAVPTQPGLFELRIEDLDGTVLTARRFHSQERLERSRLAVIAALGELPAGEVTTTALQAILYAP